MIRFLFAFTTWLVVALPLATLSGLMASLSTGAVLLLSAALAVPYAGLMWYALQRPLPRVRQVLMQGISVGYACAVGLLLSWPLSLTPLAAHRGGIAVALAAIVLGLGLYLALSPRVRTLRFQSDKVGASRRLVQLTDVHLGSLGANTLSRAMARAIAQQPDAIVITGDLVDGGEIGAAQLGALAVEHPPVYMVIGNHERYVKLDALLHDIREQQVTVLRNASETLGDLQLLGVDDSDAAHYLVDALPRVPFDPERFSVLLYHKPDDWDAAQRVGVDLMLSGHTHAGQVWPFSVLVRRRHPHWRGLYSTGQHHLYVAPGTGCWGPIFRIGSRAEITVIDIDPA